jgi:hypothetical protein
MEVVWADAVGESEGWVNPLLFEFEEHEILTECRAVGYFLEQTKEHIFLAQLCRPHDLAMARVLSIPLKSITKLVKKFR